MYSEKRTELEEYIDASLEYNIPINEFTYGWYRLVRGYTFRDMFRSIQRVVTNVSYEIEAIKAYKLLG